MLLSDREECLVKDLTEALAAVAAEVHVLHKQNAAEFEWYKSHSKFATKQDLERLEHKLMAELAVVVADLKSTIASIKQVNIDIADTQTQINALKAKILELEAAAGGTGVPQEIADLVAEAKTLAQAADDALPNPVVAPPPPVV